MRAIEHISTEQRSITCHAMKGLLLLQDSKSTVSNMLLLLVLSFGFLALVLAQPTAERDLDDPELIGELFVDTEDLPILERAKTI